MTQTSIRKAKLLSFALDTFSFFFSFSMRGRMGRRMQGCHRTKKTETKGIQAKATRNGDSWDKQCRHWTIFKRSPCTSSMILVNWYTRKSIRENWWSSCTTLQTAKLAVPTSHQIQMIWHGIKKRLGYLVFIRAMVDKAPNSLHSKLEVIYIQ